MSEQTVVETTESKTQSSPPSKLKVATSENKVRFDSKGLTIDISRLMKDFSATVEESREIIAIPINTLIGTMHFTPVESHYIWGTKTLTIARGIETMNNFFEFLESQNNITPEYLYGSTNERMAKFAQRLGFKIISTRENDYSSNRPKNIGTKSFVVIGKTEEIKQKLAEYNERYSTSSKLMHRASKELKKAA